MRRLTLSFDNGPWAGATDAVLETLAARRLPATFFVVGERLADPAAAAAARRAHDAGHWIGNHTMSHGRPLGLLDDPAREVAEIADAEAAIGALAHPDRLFRPPGQGRLGPHLLSRAAAVHLAAHGYTIVTWNNVPRDWEDSAGDWVGRALDAARAQDWSLLVLHDQHLARMPGTLARFLDAAAAFEIVQAFPPDCVLMSRGQARPGLPDALPT